jgi:hypothetical protein
LFSSSAEYPVDDNDDAAVVDEVVVAAAAAAAAAPTAFISLGVWWTLKRLRKRLTRNPVASIPACRPRINKLPTTIMPVVFTALTLGWWDSLGKGGGRERRKEKEPRKVN